MLLKLTAADHGRILNDGTGLSGKVYAGTKGVNVHFRYRYRFQGEPREMPLGAWPKIALDAIRANFEETKLRIERGGDPAGQKKSVAQKMQIEGHATGMQVMEIRHSLQRWAECGKGIARTEAQRTLAEDDDETGVRWYDTGDGTR